MVTGIVSSGVASTIGPGGTKGDSIDSGALEEVVA